MKGGIKSAGRELNVFKDVHSMLSFFKPLSCSQVPDKDAGSKASGHEAASDLQDNPEDLTPRLWTIAIL